MLQIERYKLKYVGKNITIHQVLTISNFATKENNKIKEVTIVKNGNFDISTEQIENDLNENKLLYTINIKSIDENGYVSVVEITKNR